LNIANIEALKFYAHFADVVVLARELNLDQVAEIYDQIVLQDIRGPRGGLIRIEMFCHGALCMAVSGKCYLSLHEYNTSANRGACVQICRRGYTVKDKETNVEMDIDSQYIMSPKDLKTIHFMNKMMDAGVRVFKIEGRARGAEYVKTVVNCYREAIEAQLDGSFDSAKIEEWDTQLSTVFNRGFWDGYYLGQRLGEWTHQYGSSATKRKILIGKGIKYYSKLGVAEFLLESNSLEVGDQILITGPTTGALESIVTEIRVDLKTVDKAIKGQRISFPIADKMRPSDKLYKVVATEND
jgi:putative protease